VLKGDRLVIDLKTGESRFENTGNTAAGGRIRALFMPKQEGADAKSGDAKSGDADGAAAPAGEASGDAKPAAEDQDQAATAADKASKADKPTDDVAPFPMIPGFER
jgi:lipopolysaccharide export system protein LptA